MWSRLYMIQGVVTLFLLTVTYCSFFLNHRNKQNIARLEFWIVYWRYVTSFTLRRALPVRAWEIAGWRLLGFLSCDSLPLIPTIHDAGEVWMDRAKTHGWLAAFQKFSRVVRSLSARPGGPDSRADGWLRSWPDRAMMCMRYRRREARGVLGGYGRFRGPERCTARSFKWICPWEKVFRVAPALTAAASAAARNFLIWFVLIMVDEIVRTMQKADVVVGRRDYLRAAPLRATICLESTVTLTCIPSNDRRRIDHRPVQNRATVMKYIRKWL